MTPRWRPQTATAIGNAAAIARSQRLVISGRASWRRYVERGAMKTKPTVRVDSVLRALRLEQAHYGYSNIGYVYGLRAAEDIVKRFARARQRKGRKK